nr:hypothetical protein CFP56_54448 [Quercus suber]
MPYCDTASKLFFQTKVTSHALVAESRQHKKAEMALPPTEHTCISSSSTVMLEWTLAAARKRVKAVKEEDCIAGGGSRSSSSSSGERQQGSRCVGALRLACCAVPCSRRSYGKVVKSGTSLCADRSRKQGMGSRCACQIHRLT